MLKLTSRELFILRKSLLYWRNVADTNSEVSMSQIKEAYRQCEQSILKDLVLLQLRLADNPQRSDYYKHNRLNNLLRQTKENIADLTSKELTITNRIVKSSIKAGYKVFNDDAIQLNNETLKALAKEKWSGKSVSQRIKFRNETLANRVEDLITNGINIGKSIPNIVNDVKASMDSNYKRAETLVRSEVVAHYNLGSKARYEEAGLDEVIWISAHDERTCPICAKLDGRVFKTEEAPVLAHPNCRCVIIPKTDGLMEEYKEVRKK